jgi:hypothetical protein
MSKRGMKFTEAEAAKLSKGKSLVFFGEAGKIMKKAYGSFAYTNKFHAQMTLCDGIKFQSKKEAQYYRELKARIYAGEVKYFLPQVPIRLTGGVKYVVDFVEFWENGTVHYVDVKGHRTQVYKNKKKQVEALYPIIIEEA